MAQESHSPVLVFDSPVMVLHSPVFIFIQSSLIFIQSSFIFFTQSSFIFTRSIYSPVLFSVQLPDLPRSTVTRVISRQLFCISLRRWIQSSSRLCERN